MYCSLIAPIHLPEATSLRLDRGKTIYFDVGSNEREVFLTLSEVRHFAALNSLYFSDMHEVSSLCL